MNLAKEIEEVIGRYIDSIETLDVLLLLQRSPDTFWRPEAIDSHLGLKSGMAAKKLESLMRDELVVCGNAGGYRYHVNDENLRNNIADLATAYADRRIAVVNAIYSENPARLRAFADAFKVKSE
jgi:hypothetical protein